MKVILRQKVAKLGNVGDQVNVKPGYARNYLIPQAKAAVATPAAIVEFEKHRAELEKTAALAFSEAEARAAQLANASVTIAAYASDEGKLFGSIGGREIAEAVTKQGFPLEKREVGLPQGPIRQVGEYDVALQIYSDISVTIKVIVVAEK